MTETQIKLIDAAEREFAEHGFHGASVRSITAAAKANVASINYHFGSKESLFLEMIRHRIEPVNALRLRLLDEALAQSAPDPLPVACLVEIIFRPLINAFLGPGASHPDFMRAMGRVLTEDNRFMARIYEDVLAEVIRRFRAELYRSLDDLAPEQANTCFYYMSCSLSGLLLQHRRWECTESDGSLSEDAIDSLVAFVAGGILAQARHYRETSAAAS